ncbi:hypothetical protein JAAARDRAFT_29620 [Jaapia argillacea MUCL 33604]|uniref:T6SS Phospholipase effector Tle1-like catalytic domain-containing protein n=1 Tax=Jaapia argillacea MUCL 33604 TaxID=933084 RepID=A0A067Q9H0_9AGAM|nr:hypothetical protein JAAARDRAFT_29620 [Jaapia argillacea MUCL 33604]
MAAPNAPNFPGGNLDDKSPSRKATVPNSNPTRIKKRIVVCCDGTWQDGLSVDAKWKYTNVLRIARMINRHDDRCDPPIPQIVFYQTGVGSQRNFYSEYIDAATGASLGDKVEEAYGFIANNYYPGDEIFLFGFSRGAYTARMVAAFIGEIGVLDRTDMDHFAEIFIAYQKRGKAEDKAEIATLEKTLAPWNSKDSPGKKRADSDNGKFSIKCVGVFDTVGSLGLPGEISLRTQQLRTIFGFRDTLLGEHIQRAYHALAMNETRTDFNCTKFQQTEAGRLKGQVLKQCWFAGSHSDVGGGWEAYDLADLTLTWMAANVEDILSLDVKYLALQLDPYKPWGELRPHNPVYGMYMMASTLTRKLPQALDDVTHETIHPSVMHQSELDAKVKESIAKEPTLVAKLLLLEEELKANWHCIPGRKVPDETDTEKVDKLGGSNKRPAHSGFEGLLAGIWK